MKYPILAILLVFQTAFSEPLKRMDVSGPKGADATNGVSYSGSASDGWSGGSGSDGRDGGNAGTAYPGQDSGNISVKMSRGEKGILILQGILNFPDGQNKTENIELQIGSSGYLELVAKGGDGGKGGNGGDGQDGGDGGRGSDATQYSSGGNGGNGGDGGNAGAGSSGAAAGRGGVVRVRLSEKDTALLMLVKQEVKGGKGGPRGKHGKPGSGGSGGSGGSSYSWQESDTDSDGKTTYTSHSNPGGSSGYSGSTGSTPSTVLSDGRDGEDGKYIIEVVGADGKISTYSSRYDLQVESYDIESDNKDAVLEPGEGVAVKNLKIKNTGGMPTPTQTSVRIYLMNSNYTVAEPINLIIPKSLQPNETFTFNSQDLRFSVKSNILAKADEERAEWNDSIRPLAEMTEVERPFEDFSSPRSIKITYPIEIEPISVVRSLAPGEKSRMMIKITNISEKDFGLESGMQRAVEMLFKNSGGTLRSHQFTVKGPNGEPWNLQKGVLKAIQNLKAGDSTIIEGEFELSHMADAYDNTEISMKLGLGKLSNGRETENIQNRIVNIRVSQTYQKTKDSEFLILTNNRTSRDAYDGIQKAMKTLGAKADIWDISYYGTMQLTQGLENGSSLAEDFKRKTIVVLANDFDVTGGKINPRDLVVKSDFLRTATNFGANILVVGENADELLSRLSIPTEGELSERHKSLSSYLRSQQDIETSGGRPDFIDKFSDINISRFSLWGKPEAKYIQDKATKLEKKLKKLFPERNYIVIVNFAPKLIKKGLLGIGKSWQHGQIEIRRSLDVHQGQILTLNQDANSLSTSATESAEMMLGLMSSRSFKAKLAALTQATKNEGGLKEMHVEALADSIILDLAMEQAVLRKTVWSFGLSEKGVQERLIKLKAFVDAAKSGLKVNKITRSNVTTEVARIVNTIEVLTKASTSWWEYLMPFRRSPLVTDAATEMIDRLKDNVFEKKGIFSRPEQAFSSGEAKKILAESGEKVKKDLGLVKKDKDTIKKYVESADVKSAAFGITGQVMSARKHESAEEAEQAVVTGVEKFEQSTQSERLKMSKAAVQCKTLLHKK